MAVQVDSYKLKYFEENKLRAFLPLFLATFWQQFFSFVLSYFVLSKINTNKFVNKYSQN